MKRFIYMIAVVCLLVLSKIVKADDTFERYEFKKFSKSLSEITIGEMYWVKQSKAIHLEKVLDSLWEAFFKSAVVGITGNNTDFPSPKFRYCMLGLDYKEMKEQTIRELLNGKITTHEKYVISLMSVAIENCIHEKLSNRERNGLKAMMEESMIKTF